MKKITISIVFMLSVFTTAFAQVTKPPTDELKAQRTKSIELMTIAAKEAKSTATENAKLKAAFEEYFKKQDEIKADTTLTPEVKKVKFKEANEKKDWNVKYILGNKFAAYAEARIKLAAKALPIKQ